MTKLPLLALTALALAACGKQEASAPAAAANTTALMAASDSSTAAMNGMDPAVTAKTGDSTGIVKAVDVAAGTITLDHQPIPGVGWPAMTMTFQATPPSLLRGLQPGDHVQFSVRIEGDKNQVTAIRRR